MCGGFAMFDYHDFGRRFKTPELEDRPSYNIRPSMETQVIYGTDNERKVDFMRFGMVPVWAKDEKIGYKLFNARSETLFEKPAWKRSAKSKRCLIPSNGFFEWQKQDDGKHPMYIYPKDQNLFSFAGVYDHWTNKQTGEVLLSFAIITTTPNKEMKTIHDRMPVLFREEQEAVWLSNEDDEDFLKSLLHPYDNGMLKHYEVSKLVNSAKNQSKELIQRLI